MSTALRRIGLSLALGLAGLATNAARADDCWSADAAAAIAACTKMLDDHAFDQVDEAGVLEQRGLAY